MHSDMTKDTGSTATETGRLRYCIRGVSRVAVVAQSRDAVDSIALDARASRSMIVENLTAPICRVRTAKLCAGG